MKELAAVGDRDALEEGWLEMLENPGPAREFLDILQAVERKKSEEVTLALLPLVVETYMGMNRLEDALAATRGLAPYQPESLILRRRLRELFRKVYEGEAWIEAFLRASGVTDDAPLPDALELFDRFEPFKPGRVAEHKAGWGPGVVEGYESDEGDVRIRFHDGRVRELPLLSALQSLSPIDPEDLRALLLTGPEGLKELARNDPGLAVRKAVALYRGSVTAAKVKAALIDRVVPSSEWTRWWTRAKTAAAGDPYLRVEGGSRPLFTLRDEPVSLSEESLEKVRRAGDAAEAVATVRETLATLKDPLLTEALLDEVERFAEEEESEGAVLDAVLLLEEKGRKLEEGSLELFRQAAAEEESRGEPIELLADIPGEKGRKLGLKALIAALPKEEWGDLLTRYFHILPKDLLDAAADALLKKGHGDRFVARVRELGAEPWKAPMAAYYAVRKLANENPSRFEGFPTIPEMTLMLLRCLESPLFQSVHDRKFVRDMSKRIEDLLLRSRQPLLDRFLVQGDRFQLKRALEMTGKATALSKSLTDRLVIEIPIRFPEFKKEEEASLWEGDQIFCTHEGIARHEEELRVITEEKLPENQKAIGRAAAFGDLSENAEWTAAIEDQRLLTEKAQQIEEDLRRARPIEDLIAEDGVAALGTRVTFRENDGSGLERTFTILGPWDVGPDGVISYKAPLAAGLLGTKVGEEAELNLPDGDRIVTVLAVEKVVFAL